MAGELNTELTSDSASCRTTAAWLGRLSSGVHRAVNAIHRARTASESSWRGTAAEAFRSSLSALARDADGLVDITNRVQSALEAFADEIDTVRARLGQAREVAMAARLVVTPTAILPPGPGPGAEPAPPMGPMTPDARAGYVDTVHMYEMAAATYAAKVRAFDEASATVVDARLREAEAHRALDTAMDRSDTDLNGMKAIGTTIVGVALGVIAGLQTAVSDLLRKADKLRNHGTRMQALADEPKGSAAKRAAAIWAANAAAAGEARTRAEAHRLQGPIRAIPEGARLTIAHNPGEYIRDGKGWVGLGKSAARGVPFVGTGVVVASGAADVAMGKPVDRVAVATGATLGGGAVGGMTGAAIGSFFFPGVGTVVGGVVGGVIGSVTAADGVGRVMGDQ